MGESRKPKLDSVKLAYSEKKKHIVADLITNVDGVKVRSKPIEDLDAINVIIDGLCKQTKRPVSELIENGAIVIDKKLLNDGVIVLDSSKKYHKYIFDISTGAFVDTRLSRTERIDLGLTSGGIEIDEAKPDIKTTGGVDDRVTTVKGGSDEKPVKVESEDGAIDVVVEDASKGTEGRKKTKTVKNLKIRKRTFALVGAGVLLVVGMHIADLIRKYSRQGGVDQSTTQTRIEQQVTSRDSYSDRETFDVPSSTTQEEYSNSSLEIEDITQCINDLCYSHMPCNLWELTDSADHVSMKVINEERNAALADSSKMTQLINDYSYYIFNGSLWFGDNVIKGYDYMTPISKYAILVSGETLLQLHHDNNRGYNYTIGDKTYTFEQLIDMYDNQVNMVYSDLITKGRSY